MEFGEERGPCPLLPLVPYPLDTKLDHSPLRDETAAVRAIPHKPMPAVGEVLAAQVLDEAFLGLFQDVSKGPRAP
jgi:hypothetical protein